MSSIATCVSDRTYSSGRPAPPDRIATPLGFRSDHARSTPTNQTVMRCSRPESSHGPGRHDARSV